MASQLEETNVPISSENEKPSGIPDGGYGWVIMIACVLIRVIVFGLPICCGLYIQQYVTEYKVSQSVVSWMASLLSASILVISPLAGICASKFGHRAVTMAGLLMAGIFFAAPYFYSPFWFVFMAVDLAGAGVGFAYTCSNIILTTYFDKKLSIVMGIFSAATGASSFAIVPLVDFLINKYGWRFAMLVYGGLLWSAAVLAITFKPVQLKKKDLTNDEIEKGCEKSEPVENAFFGSKSSIACKFIETVNTSDNTNVEERCLTSLSRLSESLDSKSIAASLTVPTYLSMIVASNHTLGECIKDEESSVKKAEPKPKNVYLSLLTNPIFLIFLLNNVFSNIGYDTTFIYAKQKAMEAGISPMKATFLLTAIGIGSTIGRFLFGLVGSFKKISTYQVFAWCLIIGGASVMFSRVATNFPMMMCYVLVFGFFIGGATTLTSVVLVMIMDIRHFSQGLGLTFIAQALGLVLCTPLSGFIYDMTGTFNWSFLVSGFMIMCSGLVLYPAYLSKSFRESQKSI